MLKFPDESGGDAPRAAVESLVARWFPGGATAKPLGGGGFSGSPMFLVRPLAHRPHVLKAFAAGTSRLRAEWVHRIAHHLHASEAGDLFPPVAPECGGSTLVEDVDGKLWEMVAHVDGMPTDTPSHSQIVAAMQSLARVHAALAATPEEPPRGVDSRGLTERITRARLLLEHPWRKLLNSELPATRAAESLVADLRRACGLFEAHDGEGMLKWLAAFVPAPLPCQVVLRDIWSDHVLFDHRQPDRIAGIVDLHAMGIDSPATDIGRLLGSWLPIGGAVDARWWDAAMDAYETVRPLGDRERRLVPFLAATGIVFGLDNWFRWTLEENRTFPDPTRVVSRIDRLVKSLSAALIVLNATESHAGLTLENSRP